VTTNVTPTAGRNGTRRPDVTPLGIKIAVGAVGLIVAALIAAAIPQAYPGWRFGLMVAAVALFAAISLDQIALAVIAVIAFAITNGFLEDRFGQLSWHGVDDVWRLLLLVIACAWGLAVGETARQIARMRRRGTGRNSSHTH
jgi:hypothetical protein